MSIFINNKKILGTEPSVNPGDLGLFAGVDDQFYVKKSDGTIYPIGSSSSTATQSYIFMIPDVGKLIDYAAGSIGTYSEFTYPVVSTFSTILNLNNFSMGTASIGSITVSVYNGLLLIDETGSNLNFQDPRAVSFDIREGSILVDDITDFYRIDLDSTEQYFSYEYYEMATHSTYQYAHYFKIGGINGEVGGAIELSFDGSTVDLSFGTSTLFTPNVP